MQDDGRLIRSVYMKYFLGSMLAILCSSLSQVGNSLVVGNLLGAELLSVLSLTLPVYYVFATLGNLAGIGGGALCARLIGRQRTAECKKAFTATYLCTAGASLLCSVVLLCVLPGLVGLLGAGGALYRQTYDYTLVMVAGGVFTAGIYLSFNFLRLDGRTVATTGSFLLMALVHMGLALVFTLVGRMGMLGISLATTLGAAASTIFGPVLLMRKSQTLRFCRVTPRECLSYLVQAFVAGSPGAVENLCILARSYTLNRLLMAAFGATALGALAVVSSVNAFALAVIAGGAGSLVPLLGVLFVERDTETIRKIVRSSVAVCGVLIVLFSGAVFFFAPQVAALFGIQAAQLEEAALSVRLFSLSLPFSLLAHVLIFSHLATGRIGISNLMTVLRNLALVVAFAAVAAAIHSEWTLWLSFLLAELGTLVAAALCHMAQRRKNRHLSPLLLLDNSQSGQSLALRIGASHEEISALSETVSAFCEENKLSMKQQMLLTLSLEEMLLSISTHALEGCADQTISVRLLVSEADIILRLRNGGRSFNPIAYYESRQTGPEEGGEVDKLEAMLELEDSLGIKMIIDASRKVEYTTTFGINNLTILI